MKGDLIMRFNVILTRENVLMFLNKEVGGRYDVSNHRFYLSEMGMMRLVGYNVETHRGKVVSVERNGHKILNSFGYKVLDALYGSYVDLKDLEMYAEDDGVADAYKVVVGEMYEKMNDKFMELFGVNMSDAGEILMSIDDDIRHYQMKSHQFATA